MLQQYRTCGGAPSRSDAGAVRRAPVRTIGRLTAIALALGLAAAASYATGAVTIVRMARPALGAWLAARQFYLMTSGATAFGMLAGLRIARRLAGRLGAAPVAAWAALAVALVALAPMTPLCADAARFGSGGGGPRLESWLVGRFGYEGGERALAIVIAFYYFARIAGLALLAGGAIFALVAAALSGGGHVYSSRGS